MASWFFRLYRFFPVLKFWMEEMQNAALSIASILMSVAAVCGSVCLLFFYLPGNVSDLLPTYFMAVVLCIPDQFQNIKKYFSNKFMRLLLYLLIVMW